MPALSYMRKYVQAIMMPKAGLKSARNRATAQISARRREIHALVCMVLNVGLLPSVQSLPMKAINKRRAAVQVHATSAINSKKKKRRAATAEKRVSRRRFFDGKRSSDSGSMDS